MQIRREVRLAEDSALNTGLEEEANWLSAPTLLTLADEVIEPYQFMAPLRHAGGGLTMSVYRGGRPEVAGPRSK